MFLAATLLLLAFYSAYSNPLVIASYHFRMNANFIFNNFSGEIIQEGRPTCCDRTDRCSVREENNMRWTFTRLSTRDRLFDFSHLFGIREEHEIVADVLVIY